MLTFLSLNDLSSTNPSHDRELRPLPVAVPTNSEFSECTEVIIDGVVVREKKRTRPILTVVVLLVLTAFVAVILARIIHTRLARADFEGIHHPSSTSSSPASSFDYNGYVKKVAISYELLPRL